jgi:hypothetical protein
MKNTELQVDKIIEYFLDDALSDYSQLLERTKIVNIDDQTVEVEIGKKSLTFQVLLKKEFKNIKKIDEDNYYEDVEIEVEVSEDVYEGVRTFDSSIKYFWIALLDFNEIF